MVAINRTLSPQKLMELRNLLIKTRCISSKTFAENPLSQNLRNFHAPAAVAAYKCNETSALSEYHILSHLHEMIL